MQTVGEVRWSMQISGIVSTELQLDLLMAGTAVEDDAYWNVPQS